MTFLVRDNGKALSGAMAHFAIEMDHMVCLVHDDTQELGSFQLRRGQIRHNEALESISRTLEAEAFPKLMIGVNRPENERRQAEVMEFRGSEKELGALFLANKFSDKAMKFIDNELYPKIEAEIDNLILATSIESDKIALRRQQFREKHFG